MNTLILQDGAYHETPAHQIHRIFFYPCVIFRSHERTVLQSFQQSKIKDTRGGNPPEKPYFPFQLGSIVKRKNQTGQPLYHRSEDKSHCHGKEYTQNHRKGLVRIQQIGKAQKPGLVRGYFQQRKDERTAQQFKNHRDGGRRRHPQRVEDIQQYHIRHHDCQENTKQVVETEHLRLENSMPRNVPHTVTHRSSHKHPDRRDNQDGAKACDLSSDSRVQKVHGIITHTDHQVENGQHEQEHDKTKINNFHKLKICVDNSLGAKLQTRDVRCVSFMLRLCYNPTGVTLHFFITLKKRNLNLSKKSPHKRKSISAE